MYYSIFSIDKHNKIVVECSQQSLKANLNHSEGVFLKTKEKKIILQQSSTICRFFLELTESLGQLLKDMNDPHCSTQHREYSLSITKNDNEFFLKLVNKQIFFVLRSYYPWYFQEEPYPEDYQTEEEFFATVKPIVRLEIPLNVARRWYKQAKKISDAMQQNYADEYNASKKKDLLPKKYTTSFRAKDVTIIFKTTAPFKNLSCNDRASVSIIVYNQHFMIYQSISIVSCYEPLLEILQHFNQHPINIDDTLQPIGLIFEQIRNNKIKNITSVRAWEGFKHALWLIDKDNRTINLWLYPHNNQLMLEITPSYDNNQSFTYFSNHYSVIAGATIDKKNIDQWHKRLVSLDNITSVIVMTDSRKFYNSFF